MSLSHQVQQIPLLSVETTVGSQCGKRAISTYPSSTKQLIRHKIYQTEMSERVSEQAKSEASKQASKRLREREGAKSTTWESKSKGQDARFCPCSRHVVLRQQGENPDKSPTGSHVGEAVSRGLRPPRRPPLVLPESREEGHEERDEASAESWALRAPRCAPRQSMAQA